jgi:hypothetical protein
MKLAHGVLALVTAFATTASADDRFRASAHARIGSITAPFYTRAHPIVRSELQAYSLQLDGWYRLRPNWSIGLRVPIATSSVQEPAGSYVADYTLGNPLAYLEYDHAPRATTIVRARGALGAPIAGSGDAPSLVRNRVVAASDALDGWRSTELYQPGALPLVAQATLDEVHPAWRAHGSVKLATFVRVSDADLSNDSSRIGLVPSIEVEAGWRPRSWLYVGLGAHAVVLAVPPIEPLRDVGRSGRAHLGIVPKVELVRGRASFALDVLVALAGPLTDSASLGASVAWHH